ncbi:helix-turn-helix transcriptional regulator [Emergencia timonensis]|uniref:helix-turn-helix transcriptional regulator n=1 Tax=Emergencia timonensis TaxID=1776384 RepID=UPI001D098602|nr:helix-turn-helix transcriptional regulator [Emergencia timonensis]MCB6475557.1 helix-turn-helix transcriptional regulator [Emergencia timonensis]
MDTTSISEKLVKLRGNKTQDEVARAIGISPSAYAMYESGARIPRDRIKVKIAKYYKRSVQFIFFDGMYTNREQNSEVQKED